MNLKLQLKILSFLLSAVLSVGKLADDPRLLYVCYPEV